MTRFDSRALTIAVTASAALALAACVSQQPTRTGFLGDYAALQPTGSAAAYTAVMIDPVVFEGEAKARLEAGADGARVRETFHAALTDAFSTRWRITDRPGGGVLRVRAAVTDYDPADPVWNAAALLLPIGPRAGAVSTEAEVVDSRTGERLAAQTLSFNGRMWNSPPTALFRREAHAEAGLRRHAEALAARVDPASTPQ